jgi:hypothetical protein
LRIIVETGDSTACCNAEWDGLKECEAFVAESRGNSSGPKVGGFSGKDWRAAVFGAGAAGDAKPEGGLSVGEERSRGTQMPGRVSTYPGLKFKI